MLFQTHPPLTAATRLMLIAPHPDDETLGCSVILQKAVRAGAAVRVVYITDGDDNLWPQRLIERKWRITAADRERWGKLRRAEALAALRVLDVDLAEVQFLALPDQRLTELLLRDCDGVLAQIAAVIDDWRPTDLLAPSLFDTHPDHSAVAVMMRLVFSGFLDDASEISLWNYLVHGKSPAFFQSRHRASTIRSRGRRQTRGHPLPSNTNQVVEAAISRLRRAPGAFREG